MSHEEKTHAIDFLPAKPDDLETLLRWITAYYEFDKISVQAPSLRRGLAVLLADASIGGAWFIRYGLQTVGYFVLTFGFDLEFGGRQATLTELYLQPSERRRGLGTATLEFIERLLLARGVGALELQVEDANKAARAFYQRAGFTAHRRTPMSKTLRP